MMESRHCNSCGSDKPVAEFYPSYRTQCKACLESKAALTRDKKLRYLREWKARNPDSFRRWASNPETKARRRARHAAYYEANRERRSQEYKRWALSNKDKVNALVAKRMARKLRATPSWSDHRETRRFYAEALRLTRETGVKHEVDHIVPLQGETVCGLHYSANLQILTKAENIRKGNKWIAVAA